MDTQTTLVMGTPLAADSAGGDLAELIDLHQRQNDRFFGGDPALDGWLQDEETTLHGGLKISGRVSGRGWSSLERGLAQAASRLSEGQMRFTPLGGKVIGDMAYLAGFEEGTVRLDGGDRVPMKLRVTMVLQRVDGRWLAVHRHGEMVAL